MFNKLVPKPKKIELYSETQRMVRANSICSGLKFYQPKHICIAREKYFPYFRLRMSLDLASLKSRNANYTKVENYTMRISFICMSCLVQILLLSCDNPEREKFVGTVWLAKDSLVVLGQKIPLILRIDETDATLNAPGLRAPFVVYDIVHARGSDIGHNESGRFEFDWDVSAPGIVTLDAGMYYDDINAKIRNKELHWPVNDTPDSLLFIKQN